MIHPTLFSKVFRELNIVFLSQVTEYTPGVPALRGLRQEDCEFKTSLGYIAETLS